MLTKGFIVGCFCGLFLLVLSTFLMTFRLWMQVDRWQWQNIECRQVHDIIIP